MKNIKLLISVLGLSLLFIGCSDDEGPEQPVSFDLSLDFNAMYGSEPLVMNQVVDYDGAAMRINVSEFYISEITLEGSDSSIELSEIEYVKFTGQTGNAISALQFDEIPAGQYNQLTFYIGVPSDLNHMKPADFPSDHPLAMTSNYWQGWQSYIFSKLEGKLDTTGSGSTDLTYIYHSGKDDLYTKVTIPLGSALDGTDAEKVVNLLVDHESFFLDDGDYIDIAAKPTAHNPDDLEYPEIIMGNFQNGVSLE